MSAAKVVAEIIVGSRQSTFNGPRLGPLGSTASPDALLR